MALRGALEAAYGLGSIRGDRLNKPKNVERMLSILSKIKNVDVVCLPEAWTGGGTLFTEAQIFVSH